MKEHPSTSKLFTRSKDKGKVNTEMTSRTIQAAQSTCKTTKKTGFNSMNASNSTQTNRKLSKCSLTGIAWNQRGAKESCTSNDSSPLEWASSSSVSHISLDNDRASLENNAASSRSGHSTRGDFDVSSPSDLGDSRDSRERPDSDDYLDNFPYTLPRRKPIPVHVHTTPRWSLRPK